MSPQRHGRQRSSSWRSRISQRSLVRRVEQRGDRARLLAAQLVGVALRVELADDEHDRRPLRAAARRAARSSATLPGCTPGWRSKHRVEHGVERGAAAAGSSGSWSRSARAPPAQRAVCAPGRRRRCRRGGSGRSTASGRRRRSAGPGAGRSSRQSPSGLLVAGQQQRELGLDRVGVLELVDQHDPVAAAEVVARRLARRAAARAPRTAGRRSPARRPRGAGARSRRRTARSAGAGRAARRCAARPGGVARVSVLLAEAALSSLPCPRPSSPSSRR